MPIRGWNGLSLKGPAFSMRWLCVLAGALTWQVIGCASAKVGNQDPTRDAGSDASSSAGGKDGSNSTRNDGSGDVVYGSCDPFSNSGCSSDKKCIALQSGNALGLGCGSKGAKAEGDTCTPEMSGGDQTGDDCGSQLACFKLATDSSYTCHRICPTNGGASACPGTDTCSLVVPGLTGLAFCQKSTTCLPLEQTGCPDGQACYFGDKGAVCAPTGTSPPGGSCNRANDCAKGSTCLILPPGVCSSFCSTASGAATTCTGSSTGGNLCSPLSGDSVEPNLGACRQQP